MSVANFDIVQKNFSICTGKPRGIGQSNASASREFNKAIIIQLGIGAG